MALGYRFLWRRPPRVARGATRSPPLVAQAGDFRRRARRKADGRRIAVLRNMPRPLLDALALLALGTVAACAPGPGSAPSSPEEGGSPADGGASFPVDAATPEAGADGHASPAPSEGGCPFDVTLASLTAHNTSASPTYDQSHFAANFGTSSWVSQAGATVAVDPSRMDMSMNPVTPGHVSGMDVHTLVPSRPDLRWFAHVTPWFRTGGGPHIDIGLNNDSTAYVQAMVTDMRNRGFDGLIVDWYGKGSFEDSVTLLIQQYLATLPAGAFTFIVMMDKGIANLSQSVLQTQVQYVQSQYFTDPDYELEDGKPILMFFGVDTALGGTAMAAVKSATGGDMVWVTQGAGTLSSAWVDQCFDWTHDYHDGDDAADPYNLAGVKGFLTSVATSEKKAFGSMVAGFNGTLTRSVSWSEGKYLPRGSGACLVEGARTIDAAIPANVTRMQWATWSDWEEGTEVESGVENDVSVTASVEGSTLSWSITSGTGDESTIDHYESSDGVSAADLGPVPAGTHSLDLASAGCLAPAAKYQLEVVAVGRPSIRDHASALEAYAPSPRPSPVPQR
jgi:hypothetical protein